MINSRAANAAEVVSILAPLEAESTGDATSEWIDVTEYDGYLVFTQHVGVVTEGSITGKIRQATDAEGAGAADVVSFGAVTDSAGDAAQKAVVECNAIGPYVQYVGTVATGPAVVGVSMLATKKLVG